MPELIKYTERLKSHTGAISLGTTTWGCSRNSSLLKSHENNSKTAQIEIVSSPISRKAATALLPSTCSHGSQALPSSPGSASGGKDSSEGPGTSRNKNSFMDVGNNIERKAKTRSERKAFHCLS